MHVINSFCLYKKRLTFKTEKNEVFGDLEDINFCTQIFHMFDQDIEDVALYRENGLADTSTFQKFLTSSSKNIYEWHSREGDAHYR